MYLRSAIRMYGALAALLLTASPTFAQFTPRRLSNPATGETYRIEAAGGFWSPSADMTITSEGLGIVGSNINLKNDLGLTDQRFREIQLVLRPARKHKLRFEYIPIDYSQTATLQRTIVFNGQSYTVGIPVSSELNWKAYRFAYEYDFIARDRAFAGFILDTKYTNVTATLTSQVTSEFVHAKAPVPALGGIVRFYPAAYVSVTGELTGFKIPNSVSEEYKAHYVDLNLYGTVNFNNNIGAQLGYRLFDVEYLVKKDSGNFTLKGLYFGVVARY